MPSGRAMSGAVRASLAGMLGAMVFLVAAAALADSPTAPAPARSAAAASAPYRAAPLPKAPAVALPRAAGQLPPVGLVSPFPVALRLGVLVSPRTKFAGGVDVTLPKLAILPGWSTRVDADVIASANFHGISTLAALTVDQVYSKGLIGGAKLYAGFGIGPYIASQTHFGGKLFAGAAITSRLGAEVGLHFPGFGDNLVTVQLRIGL